MALTTSGEIWMLVFTIGTLMAAYGMFALARAIYRTGGQKRQLSQ